jgi:prolipoprotein diacylglyceryltransferase
MTKMFVIATNATTGITLSIMGMVAIGLFALTIAKKKTKKKQKTGKKRKDLCRKIGFKRRYGK